MAKAQAIQAGSLFDQTMRAAPDATPKSASKAKATPASAAAPLSSDQGAVNGSSNLATVRSDAGAGAESSSGTQPRRNKRRRMGKIVFGLAIHSSLNRLDDEEEANDERRRRNRITHIQSTIEKLRSSDPTWQYLDAPRDFLVSISPSISPSSESTHT